MIWEIYQEGFQVAETSGSARYIGEAEGETFIEACMNLIKSGHAGIIIAGTDGKLFASDWGCRWFPTLKEAQESFG